MILSENFQQWSREIKLVSGQFCNR